jgi:hypothetical protein
MHAHANPFTVNARRTLIVSFRRNASMSATLPTFLNFIAGLGAKQSCGRIEL